VGGREGGSYPTFIRLGGSNLADSNQVQPEHKLHVLSEYKKCIITDRTA